MGFSIFTSRSCNFISGLMIENGVEANVNSFEQMWSLASWFCILSFFFLKNRAVFWFERNILIVSMYDWWTVAWVMVCPLTIQFLSLSYRTLCILGKMKEYKSLNPLCETLVKGTVQLAIGHGIIIQPRPDPSFEFRANAW